MAEKQALHLILVAGPPASGKTTIARQVAKALRLPLICKDTLKETLFDHLGADDREWSRRLGYAVIRCLYVLAEEILVAGSSLVLESMFIHPDTPGELRRLLRHTGARLSVVYCYASPKALSERFNARSTADRHPGHCDPATTTPTQFADRGWLDRPDYPGRVIAVDTTDFGGVDVAQIARQLQG